MAGVAPRLWYDNLVQRAATVLAVSSELTSMPRGRLLFPLRSDIWRTATGWTVTAANNGIRTGGGDAFVAVGFYATGAALAAAIVAALEALNPTPIWACTYDAGTHKFTISADVAFTLLFGSGLPESIHTDLGFATTDTGSATSHTAGSASYQSRHWVHADLGSALAFTVAAVINHNLSTAGTIRLDADATSMVSQGIDSPSIDFQQALPGDAEMRQAYFASESKRYARFVITDVQNPAGFAELGIAFLGTYLDLAGFAPEVSDLSEPLSESTFAVQGADFHTKRQKRRGWQVRFQSRTPAERAALQAVEDLLGAGGKCFFDFDSADPDIRYVILPALNFTSAETDPVTWDLEMPLREALG